MTDLDESQLPQASEAVDGRVARRQRNINAVLDVVLEMFGEESLFPTMEQAASRSGLSLRSLYRYFADPGELLEATIQRSRERASDVGKLHAIGEGPLQQRIDDFTVMRMNMYEEIGAMYRATVANAARLDRISTELAQTRLDFREQLARQFAPELAARGAAEAERVLAAADVVTQLDSVDYLMRHRELSSADTAAVLSSTLAALLS